MTSAVVLSTYNGKEYLTEQLDCIRNQSIKPDFVFIKDDKSTDGTQTLVSEYIQKYNLKWVFAENENNKGWKKNFYDLIDECSADYIFLSDQDDIWHEKKIELMLAQMENNREISVLVSKYCASSNVNKFKQQALKNKVCVEQLCFNEKATYTMHPGCSYCFRKEFFNSIKEYYMPIFPHDAFLYRFALLTDSLYEINQVLLFHRLHGHNTGHESFSQLRNDIQFYELLNTKTLDYISTHENLDKKEKKLAILEKLQIWLKKRDYYYNNPSLSAFFNILRYHNCYPKFRTLIKEIFIANS